MKEQLEDMSRSSSLYAKELYCALESGGIMSFISGGAFGMVLD